MVRGIAGKIGKFPALGKIEWTIDSRNFPIAGSSPLML
jgi:hypothetical protein